VSDEEAPEEGGAEGCGVGVESGPGAEYGENDLESAADEEGGHAHHFLGGDFESDGEEEEDDADFGEEFDVFGVVDEGETVWSHEGSGDEESKDGGDAESLEEEDDDASDEVDDEQLFEDFQMRHGEWLS